MALHLAQWYMKVWGTRTSLVSATDVSLPRNRTAAEQNHAHLNSSPTKCWAVTMQSTSLSLSWIAVGRRILWKTRETCSKELTSSELLCPSYMVENTCPRYMRIVCMCRTDKDPNWGVPLLLSRVEVLNMCINPVFFHHYEIDKWIGYNLVILIFPLTHNRSQVLYWPDSGDAGLVWACLQLSCL